ncbi:MAG: leucine-rich repeat domain-containing protein, partial [Lachnospiraceae bacterium]|nr:leucine-rich repeat domain-containing protein [Lachnospiraceae bacterium]
YQSRMGDFLLANRQYLTEVNLKVLGSSTPERLPMNTFQGCLRLKDVVLDRAQNQLKLDANLFRSSTVNELTVNGPEYATANTGRQDGAGRYYARPRMSSWACFSAVADYVPYCYPENHFEVGYPIQDDSFLFDLSVEGSDTASIRSCTYMGNVDAAGLFGTTKDKPFSIPDVVAGYKVNALQDGCLDSVRDHIVYLQIPDDTLTTLNNRVFSEADELKGVDIGNSVTSIGEGCFMKCGKLEEVTIGEGIREIGTNCFADCPKLKHVFWDVPATPGSVMIAGNAFKTIPSGTPASQVNALYFHGYAEDASYGPLAYAMSGVTIDEKGTGICYMSPVNVNVNGFSTPVEESAIQTYSMIMDKKTNKITLIDYPHFGDLPAGIQQKFLNGQSLTDPERSLILESTIIQVPAAVQSIDVDSFLNNNINNLNWSYLSAEKQERYGKRTADAAAEDVVGGLFSAVTNETAAIQAGAGQKLGCELAGDESFSEASPDHAERGNDWITNVTLPRVEFIPEGAFDSCERLQKVNIGEKCSKVGTLAFRDCNELKTIETSYTTANPYFEFNNYILYEKLSADGKEINCCLPYRGREMGPETSIASDVDGDILNQVVSIHESAFAGCVRIRSVDLEETALTRVGAGCFDGCEKLNTVKLPESVTKIGDRAFTGCADGLMVNIPNMMTYITKDAFDPPSSGNVVYIRTPKDSTAYNITNIVVQDNRNINWVDMVAYMVRFFNDDRVTQIGETQLIETPGSNARIPDTADLVSTRNPDAAFDHWEWVNPATGEIVTGQKTVENVNEDRDIFAVYDSVTHTVTFNNDDGSLIAIRIVNHGEYVVPPSERNLTTKLHPGEEDQYEFSRWLVTINGVDSNFDPYSDPVTVDVVCTACFVKNGGSILAPEEDELRIYFVSSGTQSLETEYTGDAIKPSVAVMCKNTLLTQGVDYTVKYSNNVNVSQSGKPALAIINGKGNFSGSYKMEFRITPKKLSDINGNPAAGIQIAGMSLKEGAKPKPKLVYNGKNIAGKQYSFFWNPADDTVSFSAKSGGNFSGTIAPQPISRIKEADYRIRGIKVSLSVSEKIYNGRSQTLGADELLVTDASGLIPLVKNRDYFVNYIGDTVNAGTVKVRVCGMGDYHGDITKSYRIKSAGKAAVSVNLIPEKSGSVSYTYRKSGVRPAVKVTVQTDGYTRTLREGVDYKLSYSGNKRAGKKGCCKLKFIGNYKGVKTIKKEFEILQADLKDATVIVGDMKYTTPGKYRSKAVVLLNNELVAANEYKVIYLDENGSELNGKMRLTADKTISVNVLAKNKNYTGISTTVTYKISPGMTLQDISKAKLSLTSRGGKTVKSVGYTGDYVRFDPENPARQADLVMNIGRYYKYNGRDIYSNFEVIYVDNVNCGTATVILVPRDDSIHSGICVGKFKIRKNKMKK